MSAPRVTRTAMANAPAPNAMAVSVVNGLFLYLDSDLDWSKGGLEL